MQNELSITDGAQVGVVASFRSGKPPRPITRIAITFAPCESETWSLWGSGRARRGEGDEYFVYRTTSQSEDAALAQSISGVTATTEKYSRLLDLVEQYGGLLPNTDPDMYAMADVREALEFDRYRIAADVSLDLFVAYLRADACWGLGHDRLLLSAPITISALTAPAACAKRLRSEEIAASVRRERNRWIVETGSGSHLRCHGSCDTRDEAIVFARAIRDRAWIDAVEQITEMRGGSVGWGLDLPFPQPVKVLE